MTNVRWGMGLLIILVFTYAAVLFLAHGSVRPDLLCRWDCGWYEAILNLGYVSTIPPIAQAPTQSNVAFFPLYPFLGRELARIFGLSAGVALPLLSILFAAGTFWVAARVLTLRQDPFAKRKLLFLAAYPASFYLFVGYSESLYIFFVLLGVYAATWALRTVGRERGAWLLILALSGFFLGLTRLTGFVIGGGVLGLTLVTLRKPRSAAFTWGIASVLGVLTFFAYCRAQFGAWDLYFQTLNIGWQKEASVSGFFFFFAKALPKNLLPFWFAKEPTRMSWILLADLLVALTAVLVVEGRKIGRGFFVSEKTSVSAANERVFRYFILMAAFVHLLITSVGDAGGFHRWGNGMRYAMPVYFLVVILWDAAWIPEALRVRPRLLKAIGYGALALFIPYQIYYFWLFSWGRWVS